MDPTLISPYNHRSVHDAAADRLHMWYNNHMNQEAIEKSAEPGVVKVGPGGYVHGWIKVGPRRTKEMEAKAKKAKWAFYPAFLFYGSAKTGLAKRNNFMVDALQNKRDAVRSVIRSALKESLVPR